MASQHQKAEQFRALHEMRGAFVLPNVWDGGSASLMAGLGFAAVATSSSAAAATLGKLDGALTREEALAHASLVAQVSPLPVAADLENGLRALPGGGCRNHPPGDPGGSGRRASIEDASGDPAAPIYDFDHALARVAAAVRAARAAPFPFTLTARAENFLHGRADLPDTLRRLQAFERAGADVLFAPGLPDLEAVRSVCGTLQAPGQLHGGHARPLVFPVAARRSRRKRISLSTTLYRAAMTAVLAVAQQAHEGSFDYVETLMSGTDLGRYFSAQATMRAGN